MHSAKYFIFAGILLAASFVLSAGSVRDIENLPLAMVQLAKKVAECAGGKAAYRDLEIRCSSPVAFADMRKLDMRADNRASSRLSGGTILKP